MLARLVLGVTRLLAENSGGDRGDDDERLANALAARLPVKWLGAFATRHE